MRHQVANVTIDPLDHWHRAQPRDILNACGLIPSWVLQSSPESPLIPQLDALYQHGGGWFDMQGFTTTPDGILSYPGDPDLYPLMEISHGTETFRQYPHSIVAVTAEDGSTRVTRMD